MILSGRCAFIGGIFTTTPLPLSYPKKESWQAQWKKLETYTNSHMSIRKYDFFMYNFIHVNSYNLQIHWCNFIYVNLYDLRIHIIQIMLSSIVHKGYFHGHNTLPLHGKTCSAIDEQTENGSGKTPPTTHLNVRWRTGSEVKSENLNATHAKSHLHRGMWNGQQYDRSLCMLMCSVITSHNNVIKLPLTWTRSIVEGPSVLTPLPTKLDPRTSELVVPELSHSDIAS